LFIGLTVTTLFVFRRRDRGSVAAVKTPGYPFTPIAFLAMVVLLLALTMLQSARQATLGCAVVLLGLPAYALLQRRHIVLADVESKSESPAKY
jgi:APA family basic amino acid/polyamine antiporter